MRCFFRHTLLLMSIVFAGRAATVTPTSPAVITAEFIYEKAPYRACHASTIVETTTGELVAAWFGGTAEKNPDVCIWVAHFDRAKNAWTPGIEVANGVQPSGVRYPTWNPVLFQPRSGALMLFYKIGPSPTTWWGVLRTSTDGGKTWSEPRRLPDGIVGPVKNKPVQLPDGALLAGASLETSKPIGSADLWRLAGMSGLGLLLVVMLTWLFVKFCPARTPRAQWSFAVAVWLFALSPVVWSVYKTWYSRPSTWTVHFERSTDLGQTWTPTPPLNDGITINAIQPSILLRDPSGEKLQAIGRTREKKLFTISSDDAGKTWSKMSLLKVANPSAGTDAVTLQDGRHLLVCNPVAKGRTPLKVEISRDGLKWQEAITLEDQPGEYSYPAVIQTSDGRVHITYTWKRERVKHVVLDPAKL